MGVWIELVSCLKITCITTPSLPWCLGVTPGTASFPGLHSACKPIQYYLKKLSFLSREKGLEEEDSLSPSDNGSMRVYGWCHLTLAYYNYSVDGKLCVCNTQATCLCGCMVTLYLWHTNHWPLYCLRRTEPLPAWQVPVSHWLFLYVGTGHYSTPSVSHVLKICSPCLLCVFTL